MTNKELAAAWKAAGFKATPVTPSTRSFLIKKLNDSVVVGGSGSKVTVAKWLEREIEARSRAEIKAMLRKAGVDVEDFKMPGELEEALRREYSMNPRDAIWAAWKPKSKKKKSTRFDEDRFEEVSGAKALALAASRSRRQRYVASRKRVIERARARERRGGDKAIMANWASQDALTSEFSGIIPKPSKEAIAAKNEVIAAGKAAVKSDEAMAAATAKSAAEITRMLKKSSKPASSSHFLTKQAKQAGKSYTPLFTEDKKLCSPIRHLDGSGMEKDDQGRFWCMVDQGESSSLWNAPFPEVGVLKPELSKAYVSKHPGTSVHPDLTKWAKMPEDFSGDSTASSTTGTWAPGQPFVTSSIDAEGNVVFTTVDTAKGPSANPNKNMGKFPDEVPVYVSTSFTLPGAAGSGPFACKPDTPMVYKNGRYFCAIDDTGRELNDRFAKYPKSMDDARDRYFTTTGPSLLAGEEGEEDEVTWRWAAMPKGWSPAIPGQAQTHLAKQMVMHDQEDGETRLANEATISPGSSFRYGKSFLDDTNWARRDAAAAKMAYVEKEIGGRTVPVYCRPDVDPSESWGDWADRMATGGLLVDRRGCMPAGQPFNSNADLEAGGISLKKKLSGTVKYPAQ